MAKAATKGRRSRRATAGDETPFSAKVAIEIVGLGLLGTALLSILALASYSPSDPIFVLEPVANRAGVIGASIAGALVRLLGTGAVVLVGAAGWIGVRLLALGGLPPLASRFWVGCGLLLFALSVLPPLVESVRPGLLPVLLASDGGVLGGKLARFERLLLSSWGALLVNAMLLGLGILSAFGIRVGRVLAIVGRGAQWIGSLVAMGAATAVALTIAGTHAVSQRVIDGVRGFVSSCQQQLAAIQVWREQRARRERRAARDEPVFPLADDSSVSAAASGAADIPKAASAAEPARAEAKGDGEPHIVDHVAERKAKAKPAQETFQFEDETASHGPFRLPESTIFAQPPDGSRTYDRDSLLMNSRILEKKLLDFGVRGKVVRVHPGPVITMYEYEPAAGVKVNKIVNLTDDLAMALRALSIRIIAPLPGKSVVGIEIPNPERETVYLRTLLDSEGFRKRDSKLTVAMGKDIFGNSFDADLAKMPHLLVAGATGTGKSVFLNSFLCSLLMRATPDELKLLLVDPKLLELSIYEGIPHLIADVVTSPKRAAAALAGIVRKMEERYQMMSALQVRNIDQYNTFADEQLEQGVTSFRLKPKPGEVEGEEIEFRRLPYIVVVIDELADLMVLAAKDVEESLQRLAQMARAAGIHLVLATQRPSVDVLTGVIKANFPARVSFQVSSRTDSRTILDQNGADTLLGQGDMLWLPPGVSRVQRLHGPFVSEKEVQELVAFLRDQGKPVFDENLIRAQEETADGGGASGEDVDEMFDQAVAIVVETRNASISYVQRRLKIGYNRAARIVESMEEQGMIGPQVGTRSREVFLPSHDAGGEIE